jgi:hypothetical protein
LQWKLGDHYTNQTYSSLTGWNFDSVTAKTVIVTPGALLDIKLDATGSSVNFADDFWRQSQTWTVLSATRINGNFQLDPVSADSREVYGSGLGEFIIRQTLTEVKLVWTPAPVPQQWQARYFPVAWNNAAIAGMSADPDRDGLSNERERIMGSDPNVTNAHSPLNITVAEKQITLSFELPVASGPGFTGLKRCYSLESTTNLANPQIWSAVKGQDKVSATGSLVTVIQPVATPASFYRLRVWLE